MKWSWKKQGTDGEVKCLRGWRMDVGAVLRVSRCVQLSIFIEVGMRTSGGVKYYGGCGNDVRRQHNHEDPMAILQLWKAAVGNPMKNRRLPGPFGWGVWGLSERWMYGRRRDARSWVPAGRGGRQGGAERGSGRGRR